MDENANTVRAEEQICQSVVNCVPFKEKAAFCFAALMRDMSYAITGFLTMFYLDIMGFANTAAILVIPVITRVWDGVNDPIIGTYFDKRSYTTEKARPIFKKTAVLGSVLLFMMFVAPRFSSDAYTDYVIKSIYAVLTYICFEGLHTLNGTAFMTNYNSISTNPDERTKIISVSRLFSMAGSGIIAGGIPIVLGFFTADNVLAKTYIFAGFAAFVSICFAVYNYLMYHCVKV